MLPKIALPQTKYSNTQRRVAPKKGQVKYPKIHKHVAQKPAKYPKSHKHVAQKDCNRQSKNAQICCPRKHTKRPKTYNHGAKKIAIGEMSQATFVSLKNLATKFCHNITI